MNIWKIITWTEPGPIFQTFLDFNQKKTTVVSQV